MASAGILPVLALSYSRLPQHLQVSMAGPSRSPMMWASVPGAAF